MAICFDPRGLKSKKKISKQPTIYRKQQNKKKLNLKCSKVRPLRPNLLFVCLPFDDDLLCVETVATKTNTDEKKNAREAKQQKQKIQWNRKESHFFGFTKNTQCACSYFSLSLSLDCFNHEPRRVIIQRLSHSRSEVVIIFRVTTLSHFDSPNKYNFDMLCLPRRVARS